MNEEIKNKLRRGLALTVKESWDLYQYIKTLDNELKAYREADEEIIGYDEEEIQRLYDEQQEKDRQAKLKKARNKK